MTPEPTNYFALREHEMPLPPKVPGKRSVPRMLLVGSTGAGKSRFGQHFLGTTRQNYAMKGAGRTTVSDTETIVEDTDYAGIITFSRKTRSARSSRTTSWKPVRSATEMKTKARSP